MLRGMLRVFEVVEGLNARFVDRRTRKRAIADRKRHRMVEADCGVHSFWLIGTGSA